MTGPDWHALIRATGKGGLRIVVTADDGNQVREMRIAATIGEMYQEVARSVSGRPDLTFIAGPIRHIDDHG